jgi:ADP-heptose:LPS heptosyltransferase
VSLVSENPLIAATQTETSEARAFLDSLGVREPFVVCHPGSGSPTKNWPADRFAHLVHELERDTDSEVLFVEGPADEETALLVRQAIESESKWLMHPPLGELLGLLSLAALYIGNDSGITHLAGAAGCPVLAVFGPTRPELWGPIGEKVRTLGGSSELSKLSIENVAALALSILQS